MKTLRKTILGALFLSVFLLAGLSAPTSTVFAKGGTNKIKNTHASIPNYGALFAQKTKNADLSHDMIVGTIAEVSAQKISVTLTEASGKTPAGTVVTVVTTKSKMTRTAPTTLNAQSKNTSRNTHSSRNRFQNTTSPVATTHFAVGDSVTVIGTLNTDNTMTAKHITAHAKARFRPNAPVK